MILSVLARSGCLMMVPALGTFLPSVRKMRAASGSLARSLSTSLMKSIAAFLQRKALLGQLDGRIDQGGAGEGAVFLARQLEAGDGARDAGGQIADIGR